MGDLRFAKMADVLVNYSLEVKRGQHVWIMGELPAMPLLDALYEKLILAGAHVFTSIFPQRWEELFLRHATEEQLKHTCPFKLHAASTCDKRIRIIAPENTRASSGVDPKKQALVGQAGKEILGKVLGRSAKGEMGWVVTLCPTPAGAQEAEMGMLAYEEFVCKACRLNEKDPVGALREIERKQAKMIAYLEKKKELHFTTPQGTDLRVNIEGMKWCNSCGKRNFPDGEVFTGPNLKAADGGVNGVVRYTYPAILQSTIVEDVTLTFEKGVVTEALAKKNVSFLRSMLSLDEGASRLGEIAIGTNYAIEKFTQNILFDEKIGGTFHAALGMGYPETGNTNQSGLHWDMICDLREGGVIEADGEVISKNGRFTFDDWPTP